MVSQTHRVLIFLTGLVLPLTNITQSLAQELVFESEEFLVNDYTPGSQRGPKVTQDPSGDFVVVWTDRSGRDGSGYGVFGRRFGNDGVPLGPDFQVNTYTTGKQYLESIASSASGDFVVVWNSLDQDGSGDGIFGQRFAKNGALLNTEFQVNSYTTGNQAWAAVGSDPAGDFVVVWTDHFFDYGDSQDGSGMGIFGQRFSSDGSPSGSEFQVNTITEGDQYLPSVASYQGGDFVVVWAGGDVRGQRFTAVGPTGSEFQVNSTTSGLQVLPEAAYASSGDFVVVWMSQLQSETGYSVLGRRFNHDGNPESEDFTVKSNSTSRQWWPSVAPSAQGEFVVLWEDRSDRDGETFGVFGRRVGSDSLTEGDDLQFNQFTEGRQEQPALAGDGNGRFVAVWGNDGKGDGIAGRRLVAPIFADDFESGDLSAWSNTVP